MKKSTTFKLGLVLLFMVVAGAVRAQVVTTLSDLPSAGGVVCPATPVSLTATGATGATSYIWQRYPGKVVTGTPVTLAGTGVTLTDTPTDPGYYTYVSIGVNADGCTSAPSSPAIIYVLPGINAVIASNKADADNHYCTSSVPTGANAITLTATVTKTGATVGETFAYTYQWFKGTNAIPLATASTYTMDATNDNSVGVNAYTVKVSYAVKNCTPTQSNVVNITVSDLPGKPTITIN